MYEMFLSRTCITVVVEAMLGRCLFSVKNKDLKIAALRASEYIPYGLLRKLIYLFSKYSGETHKNRHPHRKQIFV